MSVLDKLFGKEKAEEVPHGSNSEDSQEKILIKEKRDMIRGIEDMSQTSVKEVMVPRIDVEFLPLGLSEEELLNQIAATGYSRFPVYSGSIDNVVGVLHVKDLIKTLSEKQAPDLEKIIRKPFFVPESKRIDSLLREFKRRHVHIAVAVDEYGGIAGIVCMEDIIEEIVGEIQDEFDNEHEDVVQVSENMWLCDARVNINDFNEAFGVDLSTDQFDTLGGFVFDLFGKIPVKYEKISWHNFDFIVQDMEGHRINQIKVIQKEAEPESN